MDYELKQAKIDCKFAASRIVDYQSMTVDQLANGYCRALDTKNEMLKDSYMSALLLRFWYKINELYIATKDLKLTHTDYFEWIGLSIMQACDPANRGWQKDVKLNAQQVIMQILATRFKAAAFYESNLDIHKANYNNMSLDEPAGDDSDDAVTLKDSLQDDYAANFEQDSVVESIVQDFINQDKIVEAIIVDNIAFNDLQKHYTAKRTTTDYATGNKISYTEHSSEFSARNLVKLLNNLPASYEERFLDRYYVDENVFKAAINAIRTPANGTNSKLYKFISATLNNLKSIMVNG